MDISEALDQELQFLEAVWPAQELRVEPGSVEGTRVLVVQLTPLTAAEEWQQLVRCEVRCELHGAYPAEPPRFSVASSRSLSDEQRSQLLAELEAKALELAGEPALYVLLQAGREVLTTFNRPEGECAFCLCGLEEPAPPEVLSTGEDVVVGVVRTPCFHTFHALCMVQYWRSERAASDSNSALHEVLCPECRATVPLADMPTLHSALSVVDVTPASSASTRAEVTEEAPDAWATREVTVFRVVHPKGTSYRSSPAWGAQVPRGFVPCGFSGVVAETVETDTTYVRPEGKDLWLPVKGLKVPVAILTLEKQLQTIPLVSEVRHPEPPRPSRPPPVPETGAEAGGACTKPAAPTVPAGASGACSEDEVMLFEVVHHKGTCYRSSPRWDATVSKGFVPRGATGVVAEMREGDTTYIRPQGSQFWLPVKGLKAAVKLVHLEKQRS